MQDQVLTERGMFGMPKPQGWTIERIVSLMAGAVVLITQVAQSGHVSRLRVLAGWVGANLVLNGALGWCPMSVLLNRLGFVTAAERERQSYYPA